ncbi:MAG: rhodanese-like domain-containing protein, partial [Phycisphaerales bacterium]
VVVDLRPWAAFRDGHLPGAIHSPTGQMLPMVVGSYVKPDEKIVLVCEPSIAPGIIRDLVRIGYDHYVAVVPPAAIASAPKLVRAPEVSVQAASDRRGDMFVLDVRNSSEYATAHLDGAHSLPYTRLMPRLAEVPRDRPILVHCAKGGRSAAATAMLRRLGYDATNVAGGFEAWMKAGLPTGATALAGAKPGCCGGSCGG